MGPESQHFQQAPSDADAAGPQTTLCSKDAEGAWYRVSTKTWLFFQDESEAVLARAWSSEPSFRVRSLGGPTFGQSDGQAGLRMRLTVSLNRNGLLGVVCPWLKYPSPCCCL